MATTNLQTFISNGMKFQCGNGVPDHSALIYSRYYNVDDGSLYINTDGDTDWAKQSVMGWNMNDVSLGDGATSGVGLFRAGAGGIQYVFDGGSDDEWSCDIELADNGIPYDGSDLKLTVKYQLAENPSAGNTVEFQVQYAFMDAGDDSDGAGTTFTDSIVQTGRVVGEVYSDELPTNLIGVAGKTFLQISIMRDSLGAGSDTYPGSIWIVEFVFEKV